MPGCDGAGTAERSYPASEVWAVAERSNPTSEVRGGWEETPCVQGQGWPGEATSHPRPRALTLRSHPEPEAKDGSWEETPLARGQGR